MLKIGIFNGSTVKTKDVVSFAQLENILKLDKPLTMDDASFLERAAQRGQTVYVAINPYVSELDRMNIIMYDLDLEKLKNDFHRMRDDI